MKIKKSTLILLCCALALILAGSILAGVFNSGNGAVKVSRIRFEGANGQLSGLLYMPKDASENNPKPTVIVTHGYLNSAEMQDANAIELSRRGFVVLALDQYDHGHSDLNNDVYSDTSFFGVWLPFWANSMNDAVQYMYEQPYVLKDADGNGLIGVTGHSMGGFSSTTALARDEQQFAESGVRKVFAGLTEGSDFMYTAFIGVDAATADALGGGRTQGKVAAQYDEFFFNADNAPAGTVRKKDLVSTTVGKTFLEQEAPKAGTWYDTADGGKRIVYEPAETHPWNHFSKTTTASAVEFYTTAFAAYNTGIKNIAPTSQVWQWKEFFECVAIIGFILFILSVALVLIDLPFFKNAKTGEIAVPKNNTAGAFKIASYAILALAILLPGLFFIGLYDGNAGNKNILFWGEIIVSVASIALAVMGYLKKDENQKRYLIGGCAALIGGLGLALILKNSLYPSGKTWSAPVVNSVAVWTIGCAAIALVVMSFVYNAFKAKDGVGLANYGVVLKPMAIIASICTAVCSVVAGYIVLFIIDGIFKTDFRIWTFTFKTFDANIIPAILRYLPTFIVFYLISTASITINTNGTKRAWGYILAILLNAGGIILWLAVQYLTLFGSGVGFYPSAALSGIVLVAMVPTLSIAACISRALYKRTGNIWTPAIINALLMTIMTVANTTVYFK